MLNASISVMFLLTAKGWACSCTWKKQEVWSLEAGCHCLWYQQRIKQITQRGTKQQLISRGLAHSYISVLQHLKKLLLSDHRDNQTELSGLLVSQAFCLGKKKPAWSWLIGFSVNHFLDLPLRPSKGQSTLRFPVLSTDRRVWTSLLQVAVSEEVWTPFSLQLSIRRRMQSPWFQACHSRHGGMESFRLAGI